MGDPTTSLRALAHPGSVLALVVLVLNDHVLKQAWPGWVTGKLSDVAGLVVAPLLLSAALAALRVRRSLPVAVAMTGAGFVVVKASAEGAALVSALWSVGFPTVMRADATDLLALPALGIAWWVDADVRRRPPVGWRRGAASATGMVLLPIGVLATAATSCDGDDGLWTIDAVQGRFTGTQSRQAFVVSDDASGYVRIDPLSGRVEGLGDRDVARLRDEHPIGACDSTGVKCWRVEDFEKVQSSVDGGVTWRDDLVVSAEEQAESVQDVDAGCGDEASARLTFLAVADVAGVPCSRGDCDAPRCVVARSGRGVGPDHPSRDRRGPDRGAGWTSTPGQAARGRHPTTVGVRPVPAVQHTAPARLRVPHRGHGHAEPAQRTADHLRGLPLTAGWMGP